MSTAPECRQLGRAGRVWQSFKYSLIRARRKYIPTLVWYNEEIDVSVTFSSEKLDLENPMLSRFSDALRETEEKLRELGVSFDTGIGMEGRDWEWDFSLSGPISVKFRSRAERPERRKERPRPKLAWSRPATLTEGGEG